ncbi:MAG: hypothetical protein ACE5NM_00040 [Sedimentisphaerales bacterium]
MYERPQNTSKARPAAVYLSNGKVLTGKISLTPGRSFKLNIPRAGKLKTTDMVTGEDVQYGKVRRFTFEPVREICFYPEKEEMRRSWKFIEKTKYDEKTAVADYSPAAKEYSGKPYPVRYLSAAVTFNSGESLQGHLYTTTVYLQTEEKTHRLILRSKQRGKAGSTLDDLVYVRRIKLLDEGKHIAAKTEVKFIDMRFGPNDAVQAVTRQSLTPIPTKITGNDTCVVESAFGEEFYLAARKDGKYIVGWPRDPSGQISPLGTPKEQNGDSALRESKQLFALAQDHLKRHRDFYNDKELLGVLESEDGSEVLTLVNLRRKVAPTHFGPIGGEWDKRLQTVVEPWRLSIWRWKYDKKNRQLALSARGTFFRVILLPEDPTPEVVISEKLWRVAASKPKAPALAELEIDHRQAGLDDATHSRLGSPGQSQSKPEERSHEKNK